MFPSAGKLRVKNGQNNGGLERRKGHSKFLQKQGQAGAQQGKIIAAVVLTALQGNGPVRQRSLSADLIFWVLLYQDKSTWPRAAKSATM